MNIPLAKFDLSEYIKRRQLDFLYLFAGIILGIFLDWSVVEILIFSIFIWSILGPIESRYLAIPAIFFLIFTPILLALNREARAEEFSIYAYYFLVIATIRGVVELRQEKNLESEQGNS